MVICGRLGAGMAERKERIALASLVSAGEGIEVCFGEAATGKEMQGLEQKRED